MSRERRWQDVLNLIVGLWVFLSPWVLDTFSAYTTIAGLVGLTMVMVAVWALAMPANRWAEISNVLLGAGFALAPLLVDFDTRPAVWNATISGLVVALLAVWALASLRSRRVS